MFHFTNKYDHTKQQNGQHDIKLAKRTTTAKVPLSNEPTRSNEEAWAQYKGDERKRGMANSNVVIPGWFFGSLPPRPSFSTSTLSIPLSYQKTTPDNTPRRDFTLTVNERQFI
jgi:hypothetical protein